MRNLNKIIFIIIAVFLLIAGHSLLMQAQPDLPNPPVNIESVTSGSLIIPMDNNLQALGADPFNLKAYGLVHELLMNDILVKWIIRSGKEKDEIDFTANVARVWPNATAEANTDFFSGAFIIDTVYINKPANILMQSALDIINAYGNNVAVYELKEDILVDVRYTLDQRPRIAVFDNGGNQAVHTDILDLAGITNYVSIDAGVFPGLDECYTFCSEPHWAATLDDSLITQKVYDFVSTGGNFLAQCRGVEAYEEVEFFHATNGVDIVNAKNLTAAYHNNDMAFMQFQGTIEANEGGSEKNWTLMPGSEWRSGTYYGVSAQGFPDTVIASGAHFTHPDSIGGNVFYLGGHDWSGGSELERINGLRLYLNASLVPAGKPTDFHLEQGEDETICIGGSVGLGGDPTGPLGATFVWTPSATLNSYTSPNPIATPDSTTTYAVVALNGGCPVGPLEVTITVNNPPTAYAGVDDSICYTASSYGVVGAVTYATEQIWTTSGTGTFDNDSALITNYNPSTADKDAGFVYLKLSSITICNDDADSLLLTIHQLQEPNVSDDIMMYKGCVDTLVAIGYKESSITWAATPANLIYDSYLSCASACDTVYIAAPEVYPPYVDYVVQGTPSTDCPSGAISDTVRVSFVSYLQAEIDPQNPTMCAGGDGPELIAEGLNGTLPYSYLWSTGETTQSIVAPAEGTYWVDILDSVECLAERDSVVVTQFTTAILAEAGPDQIICDESPTVYLNGSIQTTSSSTWSGGNGSFNPSANDLIVEYTPTNTEIANENLRLYLTATGINGCSTHTDSIDIIFSNNTIADLTFTEGCLNVITEFNDNSSYEPTLPISWLWDFGDGTQSVSEDVNHLYTLAGDYNVQLKITSDLVCVDSITKVVSVHHLPDADLEKENTCLNSVTVFNDLSTVSSGVITTWSWSFGDGGGATDQNPTHLYSTFGGYVVDLLIITNEGCRDSVTVNINVSETFPIARFTTDDVFIIPHQDLNFIDASTQDVVEWYWDFGDSTGTSFSKSPTYSYLDTGFYNPMLVVSDIEGCKDTTYQTVIVQLPPVVPNAFTPNGDGVNDFVHARGGPYMEFDFKIYNEWGELIFEGKVQKDGWDGTRDEIPMPVGVYVYTLIAKTFDNNDYKEAGDINLIR